MSRVDPLRIPADRPIDTEVAALIAREDVTDAMVKAAFATAHQAFPGHRYIDEGGCEQDTEEYMTAIRDEIVYRLGHA